MENLKYPKEGDIVTVDCKDFHGQALVTYVNKLDLYQEHLLPIQVEILNEKDLAQFDDYNHGQTMRRYGLKDIIEYRGNNKPQEKTEEVIVVKEPMELDKIYVKFELEKDDQEENEQLSLF